MVDKILCRDRFMELIRERSVNIAIIDRTGKRALLDPSIQPDDTISSAIRNAEKKKDELRRYYLPNKNFEIIETKVPPGYEQPWHSHRGVREATLVVKGQITVKEEVGGMIQEESLSENDFVVFECGEGNFHTIKNPEKDYARILTFKFLSSDYKDQELFRGDWHAKSETLTRHM